MKRTSFLGSVQRVVPWEVAAAVLTDISACQVGNGFGQLVAHLLGFITLPHGLVQFTVPQSIFLGLAAGLDCFHWTVVGIREVTHAPLVR